MTRGRLFVIMPFGARQVEGRSQPHDFDAFYTGVLRPIAESEGWQVLRVDEVVESGTVTSQAMGELYAADLVVADVSMPNGNVYYELGVRHAVSPKATVLVALSGTQLPFDIANQRVIFYSHDFSGDTPFQAKYRDALRASHSGAAATSPVRQALENLGLATAGPTADPAGFEREFDLKVSRAKNVDQMIAVWHWAKAFSPLPVAGLLVLAEHLADASDYESALQVLEAPSVRVQSDYEVHRQRGFYLRNQGDFNGAEDEFHRAIELNPNDPETLGMLGGSFKRQGRYREALECYERGVVLSPSSLYMSVNQAAMAILQSPEQPQKGLELYQKLVARIAANPELVGDPWAALVQAEAAFALGDMASAGGSIDEGIKHGARPLDVRSLADQISLLGKAGFRSDDAEAFEATLRQSVTRRVELRSPAAPTPSNSPNKLIIHVSDPHFGNSSDGDEGVNMHRFFESENSNTLSTELTNEIRLASTNAKFPVEDIILVVSGDLTCSGASSEFALMEAFLAELCTGVGLERRQVVIVPGNHDVDWKLAAIDLTHRFDHFLTFASNFYGRDLFRELYPLVRWDFQVATARPKANEIVYFKQHGSLAIVGLNSCVFESEQDHYGFIGLRQLDNVHALLESVQEPVIRVAVMHHHLHPFPEALDLREGSDVWVDISTVRDAGLVEQRLERLGFDLVMHGHKHKPLIRETLVRDRFDEGRARDRTLIISGAGSVGVISGGLEHSEANHYALIEVLKPNREPNTDFLRISWRELSYVPGANWSTTQRWILKG